jgi:hypothetical protein
MKGSRVFVIVLLLLGVLAVPFLKETIGRVLLVGVGAGVFVLLLLFIVGGLVLASLRS